ncbi:MAG: helix-hairpin-helix domain-containing protein [Deltaproteobacteria bacterium]|jgi:competence protein ComEA|nr:helix-hairpin-helix domain-containing protein [Deltaproteobacteria bacterium]
MQKLKMVSILVLVAFLIVSFAQPVMAGKGKININTATKKELVTLNGVGKKKADRIIEYREEHPFEKIEDLKNVQGISQKTLDKNKDLITVKDE